MQKTILKKVAEFIIIGIVVISLCGINAKATQNEQYTGKEYLVQLLKSMKVSIDTSEEDPYLNIALQKKIITESDVNKLDSALTREYAAYLTNQADVFLSGKKYSYDEYLYYQIKHKKRISDISKCNNTYQPAIYKIFSKGIMIGDSNGSYSQNRSFHGKKKVTEKEANLIIKKLISKTSRNKVSYDGQVIRTSKLPKNYKKFPYILESFPNSFYEMKFNWEYIKSSEKKIDGKTYFSPAKIKKQILWTSSGKWSMEYVMNKYLDDWVDKVYTNVYTRLNANYKIINENDKWFKQLRNTYFIFNNKQNDNRQSKIIKKYIENMMQNKVIIKSAKVVVEPSTLYESMTHVTFLRVYAKFKISADNFNMDHNKLIFGDYVWIKKITKNVWIEGVYDIGIGTSNLASNGSDFSVMRDYINDYAYKGK
ncbi:hypothetical protein [Anaeromicropila herbilytica]|uniref:SLH domain-containing protein n=1 Tax=Anaeromicropila herbilytica TaxID=2785025 RepID=A0A7R7IDQ1_9FIRM|nr:hypothetical protein [Anaeromicropila herbilytica]BCN30248.1 hypothetical protein bsdtb5_15430 [Anaeromicropila herbilytica]